MLNLFGIALLGGVLGATMAAVSKRVLSTLAGCCCFGMIFLLIGIIFISQAISDPRGDKLAEYNAIVDKWNLKAFSINASVNGIGLTVDTSLRTMDAGDDVKKYNPRFYKGQFNGTLDIVVDSARYLRNVPRTRTFTQTASELNCAVNDADRCSTSRTSTSSVVTCKKLCTEACSGDGRQWTNGTCFNTRYLTEVCYQYKDSTGLSDEGCYYETLYSDLDDQKAFDPATYSNRAPTELVLKIRSEHDPLIHASRITFGSYNFGLTAAQNAGIGMVFLILGSIFIGAIVLIIFLLVKCVGRMTKGEGTLPSYVVDPNYKPGVVPGYGQPPQAFGQPPPQGYAPQPSFAQPPPVQVYGPPPQGYASPPQGYPQQQPGYVQPLPAPQQYPQQQPGYVQSAPQQYPPQGYPQQQYGMPVASASTGYPPQQQYPPPY